jgi:hypothetical protein
MEHDFTPIMKGILKKCMACIEEIINIPILHERFRICVNQGYLSKIIDEIVLQSKLEFNYDESLEYDAEEEDENSYDY